MALVECRTQAGFLEMAKEGLLAVKERAFGDPEWDNAWAEILKEENKFSEAKEHLESVLTRHPDNVLIINQLADVLSSLGEIERAMELTQKASENAPGALIRLIENKKMPTEEDLERLEEWLERAVDEQVQMNIRFTMAHTQDKLKKYEAAAKTIYDANQSVWKKVNYKHEDFTKQIDDIIQGFDKRWVMAHRVEKIFDVQPIFIVGMPRSGTTLLEQIFAAHPRVFGGGELPFMSRIGTLSEKIQKKPFPEALLTASRDLLKDGAEYYINQAKKTLGFDEPVLVDKLPHNFMDAGLICAMFPNARVIGLRRDYRAIALSNYFQNFSAWRGTLGYAFNLEAMGHHLKDFHRLMNHWQQELPPEQYREFHYEDLAQNPSEAIPAVLEFCGLDFTPEIMEFYRNKTAVRTASIRQVRNPIYTGSIEKWRHYETLLKPVIDIVEGKI
jgi:tetratricopeptide (TPR) repeat protein